MRTAGHEPCLPQRRLPAGVSPGLWDYVQSESIAEDYDDYFAVNSLFEYDEQVLLRHFDERGLVVDLGAGTGRLLVALARRGFRGLAVDLSTPMLRIVREKADAESLPIDTILANMVELECLRDGVADYCISMFSTLGMIQGAANRRQVLAHARRILKPGGRLALHVHNFYFNLFDPVGRAWILSHLLDSWIHREVELGDKVFPYRGLPAMFVHVFRRREITAAVRQAGFCVENLISLGATRQRPLRWPWFFGGVRANGWILLCRKE